MVRKVKWQMEAHFFDSSDPNLSINLQATVKLVRDMNCRHGRAVMWAHLSFGKSALALSLSSSVSGTTSLASAVSSVHSAELLKRKSPFWSFPEVVKYLLEKIDNHQAVAKINSTILGYIRPANMTAM